MSEIIRTTVEENDNNIVKCQVMNVLDDKLIRHQVRGLEQPAPEPPVLETLNVTENGTYTPEEGVDGFDEVNVGVELHGDTAYDLKDAPSGAIATFIDGVDLPLNNLIVGIDSQSGVSECNLAIDSKYGGFIEFNQLVKSGNFDSTANWNFYGNSTATASNNVCTVQPVNTASGISQVIQIKNNHKYFSIAEIKLTVANTTVKFNLAGGALGSIYTKSTTEWQYLNNISNSAFEGSYATTIGSTSDDHLEEFKVKNVMIIDLTQCFGETKANEIYAMEQTQAGSGIAYVKSLFPNDYYSYTESTPNTTVDTVNGVTNRIYHIDFPSGVTISNGSIDILNGVLTDDDLSEEYNITPIAIRSLEGVNNVFADTGDIEELEYFYDVTTEIKDEVIAFLDFNENYTESRDVFYDKINGTPSVQSHRSITYDSDGNMIFDNTNGYLWIAQYLGFNKAYKIEIDIVGKTSYVADDGTNIFKFNIGNNHVICSWDADNSNWKMQDWTGHDTRLNEDFDFFNGKKLDIFFNASYVNGVLTKNANNTLTMYVGDTLVYSWEQSASLTGDDNIACIGLGHNSACKNFAFKSVKITKLNNLTEV